MNIADHGFTSWQISYLMQSLFLALFYSIPYSSAIIFFMSLSCKKLLREKNQLAAKKIGFLLLFMVLFPKYGVYDLLMGRDKAGFRKYLANFSENIFLQ
jgi:hypothetical protein